MTARLVLLVLGVAGFAADASAYQCTLTEQNASISWETRRVVMRPTTADGAELSADELSGALEHGVQQWSTPTCSDLSVTVGEGTSELRAGFDYRAGKGSPSNQNVVVFRNATAGDPLDEWIHLDSNLAITTVTFLRSTAELLDADIELNDAGFFFTACDPPACQPRHDLANTLTHELGHVIGLEHPPSSQPDAQSATMFATSSEGDVQKRDLSPDDIDGLCTIYPEGQPNGDCGSFTPPLPPAVRVEQIGGCSAAAGGHPLLVALLAGLLGCRRRRGRRTHTSSAPSAARAA